MTTDVNGLTKFDSLPDGEMYFMEEKVRNLFFLAEH